MVAQHSVQLYVHLTLKLVLEELMSMDVQYLIFALHPPTLVMTEVNAQLHVLFLVWAISYSVLEYLILMGVQCPTPVLKIKVICSLPKTII